MDCVPEVSKALAQPTYDDYDENPFFRGIPRLGFAVMDLRNKVLPEHGFLSVEENIHSRGSQRRSRL
jgi:hypothetical protein